MATKPQTKLARVLSASAAFSAQPNDLLQGDANAIDGLANAGLVDAHPDAIAYCQAQSAKVVQLNNIADAFAVADVAKAAQAAEAEGELPLPIL